MVDSLRFDSRRCPRSHTCGAGGRYTDGAKGSELPARVGRRAYRAKNRGRRRVGPSGGNIAASRGHLASSGGEAKKQGRDGDSIMPPNRNLANSQKNYLQMTLAAVESGLVADYTAKP